MSLATVKSSGVAKNPPVPNSGLGFGSSGTNNNNFFTGDSRSVCNMSLATVKSSGDQTDCTMATAFTVKSCGDCTMATACDCDHLKHLFEEEACNIKIRNENDATSLIIDSMIHAEDQSERDAAVWVAHKTLNSFAKLVDMRSQLRVASMDMKKHSELIVNSCTSHLEMVNEVKMLLNSEADKHADHIGMLAVVEGIVGAFEENNVSDLAELAIEFAKLDFNHHHAFAQADKLFLPLSDHKKALLKKSLQGKLIPQEQSIIPDFNGLNLGAPPGCMGVVRCNPGDDVSLALSEITDLENKPGQPQRKKSLTPIEEKAGEQDESSIDNMKTRAKTNDENVGDHWSIASHSQFSV